MRIAAEEQRVHSPGNFHSPRRPEDDPLPLKLIQAPKAGPKSSNCAHSARADAVMAPWQKIESIQAFPSEETHHRRKPSVGGECSQR